jgi:hypothetical protein
VPLVFESRPSKKAAQETGKKSLWQRLLSR